MTEIRIIPIAGVGEVVIGDDLALLITTAAGDGTFQDGDVIVVTQKVVSKPRVGSFRPRTETR